MILESVLLVGLTIGQVSGGVAPPVLPADEILAELGRLVSSVENPRRRQGLEGALIEELVRAGQLEAAKERYEWLREGELVRRAARARGALALAVGFHHAGLKSERDAHFEETLTFLEPRLVHRAVFEMARTGELGAAWTALESIPDDHLRRDAVSSLIAGAVLGDAKSDAIRGARVWAESGDARDPELETQELLGEAVESLRYCSERWPNCSRTAWSLVRESETLLADLSGGPKKGALRTLLRRYRALGSEADVRRLLREFEPRPASVLNSTAWLARVSRSPDDLAAAEAALATLDPGSEQALGWEIDSGMTDLAIAWVERLGPEEASLKIQSYAARTELPEILAEQIVPKMFFIVGDFARCWEMVGRAPVPAGRNEVRQREGLLGLILGQALSLDHEIRGGCEFFTHPLMRAVCQSLVTRDDPSQLRVIPNDAESAVSYLLRIAALNQDPARFLAAGYELRDHLQGRNVEGPEPYEWLVVSALDSWRVDRAFRKRIAWFLFRTEPNPASRVRFGLFLLRLES